MERKQFRQLMKWESECIMKIGMKLVWWLERIVVEWAAQLANGERKARMNEIKKESIINKLRLREMNGRMKQSAIKQSNQKWKLNSIPSLNFIWISWVWFADCWIKFHCVPFRPAAINHSLIPINDGLELMFDWCWLV